VCQRVQKMTEWYTFDVILWIEIIYDEREKIAGNKGVLTVDNVHVLFWNDDRQRLKYCQIISSTNETYV
jgi:hypothetical protein